MKLLTPESHWSRTVFYVKSNTLQVNNYPIFILFVAKTTETTIGNIALEELK